MHRALMVTLDKEGLADIVPTTTDSYTRNEQWELAQKGIEESERLGRSMLNGYPMVNYGVARARELIEAIDKPAIMLTGTTMPRLTSEIAFAGGYTGYLGSGIAYTTSYIKELSIEDGIRNHQYLDRLAAMYHEHGVELHRRQPGFLTGTNIPPSIAIVTCVLDCLLAAAQGVKNYGLEMGETLHLIQDAAAVAACGELCQEYLRKKGFDDVFTPVTLLHWMSAWPHDEAQAAAIISYGGTLAAISGAASVTTKSTHEAFGIPTPQANAEGLRMTRMAIYLARDIRLDGLAAFEAEKALIAREVRAIVDKVLEMGDGDVAVGTVRAFEAGRHGHSVVAESALQEPRAAGARRRRLPAHPRSGPDALPEGGARRARGGAAQARGAREGAVRPGARRPERLRDFRAGGEAATANRDGLTYYPRCECRKEIQVIHCVLHDPNDSVAVVVVEGVKAGTMLTGLILDEDRTITLSCVQDIPIGHKVALKDMAPGDTVIKYGVDIGKVVKPIRTGEHAHVHNIKTKRW